MIIVVIPIAALLAPTHRSNAVTPSAVTPRPNKCSVEGQSPIFAETKMGTVPRRQFATSQTSIVLDLKGLLNRCMGNIDLAQRVLEKFQQRIPEELAELESALQLGDAEGLARIAHRLRGSSATVSAKGLAQAAADIEDASRAGRVMDVPACIERMRDEWRKLMEISSELAVEA